jgi:hypothetical protein
MFDSLQQKDVGSFLYLSVPYYWLRELLLSLRAKRWRDVPATIEETYRSHGGSKQVVRAELWYSYSLFEGSYSGHVIRDVGLNFRGVNRLVNGHQAGDKITVKVNPDKPNESFFPSGLGWIDPVIVSLPGLGALGIVLTIAWSVIHR